MEDFATISQLRNECTGLQNGTRVPKGGFAAAKHLSKWLIDCETEDLKAWKARSHFTAAKRVYLAVKWHSCAKGPLHSYKKFRRGRLEAAKSFHSEGAIFAAAHFCCEISQPMLSPYFLSSS
uniref:Uncharacterized protein n=1 Tax=Vitis vinifera TaxID=29760 RepID=A5B3X8_VITVI|nr:hypothetical protein VITISV_042850 [Vitis vinifera]